MPDVRLWISTELLKAAASAMCIGHQEEPGRYEQEGQVLLLPHTHIRPRIEALGER